jgi:predicted enzyme related to lactoylglutathione lyase
MATTSTTLLQHLDIVIVRVTDIEAARAFYGEALGLNLLSEGPGFFSVAPVDGVGATLGVGVAPEGASVSPIQTGIWWKVDDTDALHATLVARGVRITEEPSDKPFGRAVSFADPTGNILNAYQAPR